MPPIDPISKCSFVIIILSKRYLNESTKVQNSRCMYGLASDGIVTNCR